MYTLIMTSNNSVTKLCLKLIARYLLDTPYVTNSVDGAEQSLRSIRQKITSLILDVRSLQFHDQDHVERLIQQAHTKNNWMHIYYLIPAQKEEVWTCALGSIHAVYPEKHVPARYVVADNRATLETVLSKSLAEHTTTCRPCYPPSSLVKAPLYL